MRHWHFRTPSYVKVSHSHEGGDKYHEHPHMKGYGRKKSTIRLKVRSKSDMSKLPESIVGYAVISRIATALFP